MERISRPPEQSEIPRNVQRDRTPPAREVEVPIPSSQAMQSKRELTDYVIESLKKLKKDARDNLMIAFSNDKQKEYSRKQERADYIIYQVENLLSNNQKERKEAEVIWKRLQNGELPHYTTILRDVLKHARADLPESLELGEDPSLSNTPYTSPNRPYSGSERVSLEISAEREASHLNIAPTGIGSNFSYPEGSRFQQTVARSSPNPASPYSTHDAGPIITEASKKGNRPKVSDIRAKIAKGEELTESEEKRIKSIDARNKKISDIRAKKARREELTEDEQKSIASSEAQIERRSDIRSKRVRGEGLTEDE